MQAKKNFVQSAHSAVYATNIWNITIFSFIAHMLLGS